LIARVVALTSGDPPGEATHWTAAAMAKATGISVSSVQRIWRSHGLAPHRVRQFKLSNDPKFADKLKDVVGIYVDPPAHVVVLSVDEKSQIQALDRTQPGLPMKKGRAGTLTHDYKRNGTTTLFAALNILEGMVIGRCMQRHRHQEFIRFLNAVEAEVPVGKVVHLILDNYATHKHPKVMAGPASPLRLPLHAHLGILAQRRRGLLRQTHPAPPQTRRLPIHRRSAGRYQPLCRRNQRPPEALRLDRRSRQHHCRRQARAPSVRVDPLAEVSRPAAGVKRQRRAPGSAQRLEARALLTSGHDPTAGGAVAVARRHAILKLAPACKDLPIDERLQPA
jgi:hypothetical protein